MTVCSDGMERLMQLEDESGELRKLVADPSLDKEMLQNVIRRYFAHRKKTWSGNTF